MSRTSTSGTGARICLDGTAGWGQTAPPIFPSMGPCVLKVVLCPASWTLRFTLDLQKSCDQAPSLSGCFTWSRLDFASSLREKSPVTGNVPHLLSLSRSSSPLGSFNTIFLPFPGSMTYLLYSFWLLLHSLLTWCIIWAIILLTNPRPSPSLSLAVDPLGLTHWQAWGSTQSCQGKVTMQPAPFCQLPLKILW